MTMNMKRIQCASRVDRDLVDWSRKSHAVTRNLSEAIGFVVRGRAVAVWQMKAKAATFPNGKNFHQLESLCE